MYLLKKCPACGSDAAELGEYIRVGLPINTSGNGYRVRCKVCGYKGEFSRRGRVAILMWNNQKRR